MEPVTPDHLAALVNKFGKVKASLKDLRLLALCLIGYAGFLRFNELSNIKRKDIVFYDAYAKREKKRKEKRKEQNRCLQRMEVGFDCENRQLHLPSLDAVVLYSEGKDHI